MSAFLAKVAQAIVDEHPDLRRLAIILPSRRSSVFLKEELSKIIQGPLWSPLITTSEDFVLQDLEWELADQPTLIFKLYEAYSSVVTEPRESFSEFSHWAQLLLADFNEIDRYLVDYRQLFNYLADVERIRKWDLQGGEVTDMIANYLKLWESLPAIYEEFTSSLRKDGRVYQGMAYRQVSNTLDNLKERVDGQFDHVIFVGFNALNTAEKKIFNYLYQEDLASFYWDIDRYYFEDRYQEAGLFLRKDELIRALKEKGDLNWVSEDLTRTSKKIKVIGANGDHQQAVIANKLIEGSAPQDQQDIALVLAEERLLPAFLNNLSSSISSLNITMGLPLAESSMAGLFQLLVSMLRDQEQHRRSEHNKPVFHHRYWTDLLGNNLMPLWSENPDLIHLVQYEIVRRNRIYLSADEVESWQPGVLGQGMVDFFNEIALAEMSRSWSMLAELAQELYQKSQGRLDLPQPFYGFYRIFNRLADLMREYPYVSDWQTAVRFYRELIASESLDLKGDPLSGVQVMGMLETRTLDFKRLIITSLNEDVLPKGRSENSLIPFEIRKEFGLPTYLDKDAVFAYHFYRLLQRAEDITLIYNSASQGLHTGEPSRFIRQLEFELQERNPEARITEVNWNFPVSQNVEDRIEKSPGVLADLEVIAAKGISPTAIIDYINDQTEFYRKRILRLRELEEVEEVAGYDTQGNVVHQMLEDYYLALDESPSGKRLLEPHSDVYKLTRAQITDAVEQRLTAESGHSDFSRGKNLIIREILTGMIQRFLIAERAELMKLADAGDNLEILGLEKNYSCDLTLSNGKTVRVHGNIDRIDCVGGTVRIIDYKTGAVEDRNLKVEEWDDLRQPKEGNKSLQLMMYAWLYLRNHPDQSSVQAGIISLRKTNKWLMPLKVMKSLVVTREMLDEFEAFLKQLLEEIFDPELPFEKNPVTLQSDE
jgi:ATP-dependent helicase/nuclease subunit B